MICDLSYDRGKILIRDIYKVLSLDFDESLRIYTADKNKGCFFSDAATQI